MKLVLKDNRRHFLRFDKGEELFAVLSKFMLDNHISAAAFTAIGTCSETELGYFNVFLKEYRKKLYKENLEIVSLIGNCSMSEGKPAVHAHASFSRTDFSVIGGHVFKIVVLATCEVFLIQLDGVLERKVNPEFNLSLLT